MYSNFRKLNVLHHTSIAMNLSMFAVPVLTEVKGVSRNIFLWSDNYFYITHCFLNIICIRNIANWFVYLRTGNANLNVHLHIHACARISYITIKDSLQLDT